MSRPKIITDKQTVKRINHNWGEITENLPIPGRSWTWCECDLPPRIQHRLKNANLIERDPSGERWMTSEKLWLYVIEKAGADESIGCRLGQELLDVPQRPARPNTWHEGSETDTGVQQNLSGDKIETESSTANVRQNFAKNPIKDSYLDVSQYQTRLVTWSVMTAGEFRPPNGAVYPDHADVVV